jgi:hypothetical protein
MGLIATAIGVHVGTSGTRKALNRDRVTPKQYNHQQEVLRPILAWFDGLSDADAWSYASTILGASKGSRYADREALTAYHRARIF